MRKFDKKKPNFRIRNCGMPPKTILIFLNLFYCKIRQKSKKNFNFYSIFVGYWFSITYFRVVFGRYQCSGTFFLQKFMYRSRDVYEYLGDKMAHFSQEYRPNSLTMKKESGILVVGFSSMCLRLKSLFR